MVFLKICVVGLGEVGLATAIYVLNKGFDVYGYDISIHAIERAKKLGINASIKWIDVPKSDVYIICVSTLLKEGMFPDVSPVFDVAEKIARISDRNTLVSIESTIVPGTSRKIFNTIFHGNVKLVHVPHRYWRGDPVRYGVKQHRVIGAINNKSLDAGLYFYKDTLDIPLHVVSSIEVAEMCKIAENAYRYVQIAFAEELRMICESIGLNFEEVRRACNTKWNIEILEARNGIGGHCLPKDIRYVIYLYPNSVLLKAAIEADKRYREWLKNRSQKTPATGTSIDLLRNLF